MSEEGTPNWPRCNNCGLQQVKTGDRINALEAEVERLRSITPLDRKEYISELERVVEAAKKLNAMWGDAQVNLGPAELALYKALRDLAQTEMKGDGK